MQTLNENRVTCKPPHLVTTEIPSTKLSVEDWLLEVAKFTSNEQESLPAVLPSQPSPEVQVIDSPLFGTISVTENPFAENHCPFCGKALPAREPGQRGRPTLYHNECGQLSRSLDHLAKYFEQINFKPEAARRLRGRLISIANQIPAPRDNRGRFSSNKPSTSCTTSPRPSERSEKGGAGGAA